MFFKQPQSKATAPFMHNLLSENRSTKAHQKSSASVLNKHVLVICFLGWWVIAGSA
jgi:hypothetical protein